VNFVPLRLCVIHTERLSGSKNFDNDDENDYDNELCLSLGGRVLFRDLTAKEKAAKKISSQLVI
jgi:hypothetical protein